MKNMILPQAQNDRMFAFVGNPKAFVLMMCAIAALITVIIIYKKRKGGKK